jgi:glycosyltransferase involved in cell wall biosynthesis
MNSTTRLLETVKPISNHAQDYAFETELFLEGGEARHDEGGLRTYGYFKKNQSGLPLITVITVVFNGEEFLEKTIQSVINQTYDNVEFIIIDGGSNDRTLEIIRKYEYAINYWVSEKDNGIYDAMNKGVTLSSGSWLNFMNAGDQFVNSHKIAEIVGSLVDFEGIFSAKVEIVNSDGVSLGYCHPNKPCEPQLILKENCIAHQSAFTSIAVFKKIGLFKNIYKIQGDYDFWIRAYVSKIPYKFVNTEVSFFANNGISSERRNYPTALREAIDIYSNYKVYPAYKLFFMYIFKLGFYSVKSLLILIMGNELSGRLRRMFDKRLSH